MKNLNKNKKRNLNLILAIIVALLMLLTAYFLKNSEYKGEILNGIIFLWLIPFFYFNKNKKKCCS
jgi:xanthine/uracil permease